MGNGLTYWTGVGGGDASTSKNGLKIYDGDDNEEKGFGVIAGCGCKRMHLVPDKKHPTLAFNSELRVKFGLKMLTNEKSNSHNQPASRKMKARRPTASRTTPTYNWGFG